ncbi:fused adenylate cyclase/two component hybrid sensor/regulator [Legionella rubrilucens]|uniref:Fused adenylate cyclase/two component hybrid sensor/regulator n=1 Tax=Legionella rubrilucens TaxID=458 RepID=A0A0W0XYZ1_9GAMM|nr:adenylate/guanylate cyclase domain-containing protein [Legionella rubrilucens]KTD49486.1 fused adenylate cyclase/two component hybrid sensor/regulator [Legionella rubrilucens]
MINPVELEEERLAALYELQILDTPPEERFDRIVNLAVGFLRVPIGYIALIDAHRQWFKARCGIFINQSARSESICHYTIQQNEPLIIPDILMDSRFADKYAVFGEDNPIRFYAGVPLSNAAGLKIGTLCVADKLPRHLNEGELKLLCELARQAEDELALLTVTKLKKSLREANTALNEAKNKLELRNELLLKMFSSYMSDEVVKQLLASPKPLQLGGEKRKISVLFSDLRDFTSISRTLPPETLVDLLNHYFCRMASVIEKYHGTINAFIGDAIMVIFGAPQDMENHALSASACAIEMQQALKDVNEYTRKNKLPELSMGIGINTGIAVIGNIGSDKRQQYTAIGCAVNLSSRIQSLTSGGQILISEHTLQDTGNDLIIKSHSSVQVKGFEDPVKIYEVEGIDATTLSLLKQK